tara:strand:- start:135 stop:935 length:801 start_codon:yes stop_codon:yes gene_type:complete
MPIKIACIGCSWTEGERLPYEKTISYPEALYNLLSQTMPDISVYNCGIGGTSAKLHKILYTWVIKQIKPDFIIHQITDICRTQITNDESISKAFNIQQPNNDKQYYKISISQDKWAIVPVLDFLGLPLKDDKHGDIKTYYDRYFKNNPIFTFEKFLDICRYKYHFERESEANHLDYIADIDYILKYNNKLLSFFWNDNMLNFYSEHQKNYSKVIENNFVSIENHFKTIGKNIFDYSHDKWMHLNTNGNQIVANFIKDELIKKKVIG